MPAGYEHMRDDFISQGMPAKKAKKKAAMIWNAKHKGASAVGPHREAIDDFNDFMEDRGERLHQTSKNPDQAKFGKSRGWFIDSWKGKAPKSGERQAAKRAAEKEVLSTRRKDMKSISSPGKGVTSWSIAKEDIDTFANFMEEYLDEAKAHPGFKKVQGQIAKKMGVSKERAGAILASKTRHASAAAKRKNPKLKKVKG